MENFTNLFQWGFGHLMINWTIGPILFLTIVVSAFQLGDIKRVIYWIFVFGLSVLLGSLVTASSILSIDSIYIKLLMSTTIIITAISNITFGKRAFKSRSIGFLCLIVVFGIIHGFAFGEHFSHKVSEINIWLMLLYANLGFFIAQLVFGLCVLIISQVSFQLFHFKHRDYILVVSSICLGAALEILRVTI